MEVGRAFGAPFKDPKWVGKVALAVLFSLIPIVNVAVPGWGIQYIRNVREGNENQLPEWNGFGSYWVKGLTFGFASFVYYTPALLIVFGFGLPAALSSSVLQGPDGVAAAMGSVLTGVLVALIFSAAVSVLTEAARVNYAVYGTFGAAFGWKEILGRVRSNVGAYFTAWVLSIVAFMGLYAVGFTVSFAVNSIPCLGQLVSVLMIPILMAFGTMVGMGINGLFGQYARLVYGTPEGSFGPLFAVDSITAGADSASPADSLPAAWAPPAATPSRSQSTGTLAPVTATNPNASAPALTGQAAVAAAVARMSQNVAADVADLQPVVAPDSELRVVPVPPSDEAHVPEPGIAMTVSPASTVGQAAAPAIVTEADHAVEFTVVEPELPTDTEGIEPVVDTAFGGTTELEPVDDGVNVSTTTLEPPLECAPEHGQEAESAQPVDVISAIPEPVAAHDFTPSIEPATVARPTASVAWRLRVLSGPSCFGQTWTLPRSTVRVGRDPECFISIADGKISRTHVSVTVGDAEVRVADLGSSNGSFINGRRIDAPTALAVGDELRVGDTTLIVEAD